MNNTQCPKCGEPKSPQAIQCRKCSTAQLHPGATDRAMQAYHLHVEQNYTLQATGAMMGGITRERVRALVVKAKSLRKEVDMAPRKQFNATLPGASAPVEIKTALEQIAKSRRISIAEAIREAVTQYVKSNAVEPAAQK